MTDKGKSQTTWLVATQVVAFVAIMAVCGIIVPWAWKLVAGGDGGADVMVATSAVYSLLTLAVFVKAGWSKLSPAYLQSRPWAVFAWSALVGAGAIIPGMLVQEMLPDLSNVAEKRLMQLVANDYGFFTLCLFAPFVEEVVFRGAVLRALLASMKSRWGAIVISAALFAAVHFNPAQLPMAVLAGLFLGWIYSRTGSILPGVVYHFVNNTIAFAMMRVLPPEVANGSLADLFGGDHRRMALAVIFSLFILLPSLYQLAVRTKRQ